MNNNIKKESLDLEAMMNHLDQKAELESLNEMLNMLGVELLTVKDGLQQIENGKHELAAMNENMNDWVAKSELLVETMREIASGIMDSKPEVIIGESAKHDLKVIFNSHVNFMAALLNGFTDSQDKEHAEFKEDLKKVFEESEETERKKLLRYSCWLGSSQDRKVFALTIYRLPQFVVMTRWGFIIHGHVSFSANDSHFCLHLSLGIYQRIVPHILFALYRIQHLVCQPDCQQFLLVYFKHLGHNRYLAPLRLPLSAFNFTIHGRVNLQCCRQLSLHQPTLFPELFYLSSKYHVLSIYLLSVSSSSKLLSSFRFFSRFTALSKSLSSSRISRSL